jgi:hypothetical protein
MCKRYNEVVVYPAGPLRCRAGWAHNSPPHATERPSGGDRQ